MIRNYVFGLMLIAVIYVLSYPICLRIRYGSGVAGATLFGPQYEPGYMPVEMAIDSIPMFGTAMTWIARPCGSEKTIYFKAAFRSVYRTSDVRTMGDFYQP